MYVVVYEIRCCGVIRFQWRRWLWVVECFKYVSGRDCHPRVVVNACYFRFRGGRYYMFEFFTLYQDCAVKLRMFREVWMIGEMEVAGNATPCFRCHQLSCIAVYVVDQITCILHDEGVRVRVQVIHELLCFFLHFLCRL